MTMKHIPNIELISGSKYPIPVGLNYQCGYLTVPESRSHNSGNYPNENNLRIYFTKVKSLAKIPAPDPIIFLYGGPGGNSARLLQALEMPVNQDLFLGKRDFIIFDQRGTGYSDPNLAAPEVDLAFLEDFFAPIDADARSQLHVEVLLTARERFIDEGINLTAINTPELVADMNDLRIVLGYDEVNLYGISYGSRAALVAMRDFPEGAIRSVVLDSVVPVQVNQFIEAIPNAAYGFDLIFERVASDHDANMAYPNLKANFLNAIEYLNETSEYVSIKHPLTEKETEFRLTGDIFVGVLCGGFFSSAGIAGMPSLISEVAGGEYKGITKIIEMSLQRFVPALPGHSLAMYYSVNCCDDKVTAGVAEKISEYAEEFPEMSSLPLSEFHLGKYIVDIACKWGARQPGPVEYRAVESDIPTLILAGEYDQNTPAFWGQLTGETLSNSHYIEFPGMGHGVIAQGECAASVIKHFYDYPLLRPNDQCVNNLPDTNFVINREDR